MCGITGWIDWETDLEEQEQCLSSMAQTLSHRGPDAAGLWLSPRAALAHRRLIVVDPQGGGQPMVRRRGEHTYVIVYNGELYNTPELRRALEARGHSFLGRSDTEALLLGFMEWGPACLERLNGIFAFAIWSEAEQSLFLARDRLGVKPLFYAQRGSAFLFGSELKALLAHPLVQPEVDTEGLAEVFALGPARTPGHGVFRHVAELKAGHCLVCDRQGLRPRRYWALESLPHRDDPATTVQRVRELLRDAVERQLVSDVPVCTLLSGGLDSSAITAFATRAFARGSQGHLQTYSVDYLGNETHFQANAFEPDADAPWALRVAGFLGTRHRAVTIDTPQLVEALVAAMEARDLPGMADVDASLLLFCREVKKEATVALSGECADEIFGGYPWFHRAEALAADTFPWFRMMAERSRLLSAELAEMIKPEAYVKERYREALAEVPRLPGESPLEARMREMFYLNLTRWMPTLLDRKDRMSMAVGLEVRVPFCDHRLVEYVWNMPWTLKNCQDQPKGILRQALAGVLPGDVLERRKSPYPKTHNPAYAAAVRGLVLDILEDPTSPLLPFINTAAIREIARRDLASFDLPWFGQLMRGPQLFAHLVQVDAWLRRYRVSVRGSGTGAGHRTGATRRRSVRA